MKSGVAAIIGRPNVGKSSLINALLKTQAVIVSPKPQTTRNSIRCIYNDEDAQIVFTDTPGLFKLTNSRDRLGAFLNDSVRDSLDYADAAVWLIDAGTRKLSPDDYELAQALSEAHSMPVILAANKSEKSDPAPAFKLYDKLCTFTAKLAISARLRRGLDDLLVTLKALIPEGTPIYDPDILMDTTERFMAGEAIRGKLMMMLHDEVPHRVAVEIDEYKSPDEYPDRKKLYVRASLIVETDGQKKILIGADGSMIKRIGVASRAELEKLTGHSVYLELWVKVLENWRRNQTALKRLGYS